MAVFPNRNKCKCCQLRERKGNSKQIKAGWGSTGRGVRGAMAGANLLSTHSGIFLLKPLFTTLPVVLHVLISQEVLKSILCTDIYFGF